MEDRTLKDIADYLGTQRTRLEEVVASIAKEAREVPPDTGSWSVAGILEHLGIVEARVTGLVTSAAAGLERRSAPATGADSSWLDLSRLLDRSRKVQSTEASRPTGQMTAEAALELLRDRREALLASMAEMDGLPLESVSFPHPAMGSMNLYQWLRFIGAHEARHIEQIVEVAEVVVTSGALEPPAPS